MPIPVNKYNNDISTTTITQQKNDIITIQDLFTQIIQLVLSSRLLNKEEEEKNKNYCLINHDNCCLNLLQKDNKQDNSCIIINILQKESDVLLERCMMSFDVINNTIQQQEGDEFISTISNFIHHESPIKKEHIDMYTIASLNNTITCHSYNSTSNQERIEFRLDAHLKAKRFHLPNLLLEIVYDENVGNLGKKRVPMISLQSLSSSSPTFMSWSKMQQQQDQQKFGGNNVTMATAEEDEIHPLATTANHNHPINIATTNSQITMRTGQAQQQQQQHIPIIAVRRLSRLSLSAMQLDEEEEEEEKDAVKEDVIMQDISTSTSIPIPSSSRMQYTTHHHHHHHGHSSHHSGGSILRSTIAYSTSPINNIPHHHHFLSSSFTSSISSSHHNASSSFYLSPNTTNPQPIEKRRNSITDQQHHHSLVGSFEESLLSGRMSSMPSKSIEFICQIGVLGRDCKPSLKCPPHWTLLFQATYYQDSLFDQQQAEGVGTPYVGTIDLNQDDKIGYRIPPKGQLQVVVKNPNKTAVKLFLIPYDFTDMPKNTKTFLRQKSYQEEEQTTNMIGGGGKNTRKHQLLRYAIHLQFCRNEKKRIYLYKSMRIVFANRKADSREKFNIVIEDPGIPKYLAL